MIQLQIQQLEIVSRSQFGGGVVRIPILTVGTIDRKMTSGGGEGKLTVTREMLKEIAANFHVFGRPVPFGVEDHKDFIDRAGPEPARSLGMMVKGDFLFSDTWLSPGMFGMLMVDGAIGGFSVEMGKNRKTPTGPVNGWSVHGGIFTNRPAAQVHFAPELEDAVAASCVVQLSFRPERQEDTQVSEQNASLEQLQADVETKDAKITSLSASLEEVSGQRDKANEELATLTRKLEKASEELAAATAIKKTKESYAADLEQRVESLEGKFSEVQAENAALKKEQKADKIRSAVLKGIREGRDPKTFDGYKDDPVTWLKETLGSESVDALERFIAAIPVDPKLAKKRATASGQADLDAIEDGDDDAVSLSDEERAIIKRVGGGTDFVGITNEEEARARFEELQERESNKR